MSLISFYLLSLGVHLVLSFYGFVPFPESNQPKDLSCYFSLLGHNLVWPHLANQAINAWWPAQKFLNLWTGGEPWRLNSDNQCSFFRCSTCQQGQFIPESYIRMLGKQAKIGYVNVTDSFLLSSEFF